MLILASVRKVTLIIITLAYLSSFTELHEFFKVANLFAHFIEHREQDETLSFTDFLSLHYGLNSAHGSSSEHEDQLPFKSEHLSIASINLIAPIITETYTEDFSFLVEAYIPVAHYQCIAASELECSIWQPPKLVV